LYNPLDLSGKLVLVTGASSGIGRATSIVLSRLGAQVVLTGRREAALRETCALLEGGDHLVEVFDLSEIDLIPQWLKGVAERAGRPFNGLVHCAGVSRFTPIAAVNRANIDQMMVPNLYSALALLRAASRKGVGAEGASVVMLSSVASVTAVPGMIAYASSKAALNAAVRTAAAELKDKRIRVNCLVAAYVRTPMMDHARDSLPDTFREQEKRQFLGLLEPDEIAVLTAYLLSDMAARVTGATIVIDGGYTC